MWQSIVHLAVVYTSLSRALSSQTTWSKPAVHEKLFSGKQCALLLVFVLNKVGKVAAATYKTPTKKRSRELRVPLCSSPIESSAVSTQDPGDAQIPALRTAAPHKKDTDTISGAFRRSADDDDSESGLALYNAYQ